MRPRFVFLLAVAVSIGISHVFAQSSDVGASEPKLTDGAKAETPDPKTVEPETREPVTKEGSLETQPRTAPPAPVRESSKPYRPSEEISEDLPVAFPVDI